MRPLRLLVAAASAAVLTSGLAFPSCSLLDRLTAAKHSPAATHRPAPQRPSPSAQPVAGHGRVIVIDPGHNPGNASHSAEINQQVDVITEKKACDTAGTSTDAGYPEWSFALDVAHRTAALLRRDGFTVILTHDHGSPAWGPCITERAAIGNRNHALAAISIHGDGGPSGGRGFHVIEPGVVKGHTEPIVGPSDRFAHDLIDAFRSGTGMPVSTYAGSGGLSRRTDLGGLNLSTVPKVFIECGNMRNSTDAGLMSSASWRQRAAEAIARAIEAFVR